MKAWKAGWMACAIAAWTATAWADQKPGRMSAQEVSNIFKTTNQALSEGIAAAERHIGGKAVDAECFGAGDGQSQSAICQVTVLTSENQLVQAKVGENGKILGQNNVTMAPGLTTTHLATFNRNNVSVMNCLKAAERHVNGKAIQVEALKVDTPNNQTAACKVTVLTNDNKLVQANVTQTGQVIGQQNIDSLVLGSGFAVAPGLTTDQTTMAPKDYDRPTDQTGRVITTADRPQANETASADDFAQPRRVQKATDLMGKNVTNSANENLGEIQDIVIDASSGRILYGVLSFGGLLGMGDKYFAIPWSSMDLGSDYRSFVLNVDKDRLKDSQGFNKEQWPNFADERWAMTTHQQFNQKPYWQDRGTTLGSGTTGTQDNYRDRWYQKVTNWKKVSSIVGADIRDSANKDLGEVDDLIIDPDHGRVIFAVISQSGKLFPVPMSSIQAIGAGNDVTIKLAPNVQLQDSITFTSRDWPNMVDTNWSTRVFNTYNVQPYWTTGGIDRNPNNPNNPNKRPIEP